MGLRDLGLKSEYLYLGFFFFVLKILYIQVGFGPGMPNTQTRPEPASGFFVLFFFLMKIQTQP